ncbi:putative HNHc nuclease [Fructilactobacillus florum]|uniref:putative HNHc nuclease n=2 Tax=Fructilactobacillus florum TaxID=640331 RepID=UPI002093C531|nr:putative HNHc nuclease [Fructilactobacillus florum]
MMFGQLTRVTGKQVTLNVDEDIDISRLRRWSDGKQPTVELIIDDGRRITPDQRKKIFAMLGDMSDYLGYSPREIEEIMKTKFIVEQPHPKWFSMSDCSKSLANEFLTFIIDYCIKQDIPFKTRVIDEIQNDYRLVHECLLHRICVVCGKPHADIHHIDTVGRGFNRNKINHVGKRVLPLCRNCHQQFHSMGAITFFQQNKIIPIKLTEDDVISLNLESKKTS